MKKIALPFPKPVAAEKPKSVVKRNVKEMVASGFAPDHAAGAQESNRVKRRSPSAHIISKPAGRSKLLPTG